MIDWRKVILYANNGNLNPDKVIYLTDEEWKGRLNEKEYHIMRKQGTERAFSNAMCDLFTPGIYSCVGCNTILFDSKTKFHSQTGWPSFSQPFKENAISYHVDESLSQIRIEVRCNCCESHLGHVFPDGPQPGGLRYCINSISIKKTE